MREDFEATSSSLIDVDPYHRSIRSAGRKADVSSFDFKAGRGSSGVDPRGHPKEDFIKLSKEQKDELSNGLRMDEGMKQNTLNFKPDRNKRGRPQKCEADNKSSGRNWNSKFRKAIKTDEGSKSIMKTMATEDGTNQALV